MQYFLEHAGLQRMKSQSQQESNTWPLHLNKLSGKVLYTGIGEIMGLPSEVESLHWNYEGHGFEPR